MHGLDQGNITSRNHADETLLNIDIELFIEINYFCVTMLKIRNYYQLNEINFQASEIYNRNSNINSVNR